VYDGAKLYDKPAAAVVAAAVLLAFVFPLGAFARRCMMGLKFTDNLLSLCLYCLFDLFPGPLLDGGV
jgi:hypothetical protein